MKSSSTDSKDKSGSDKKNQKQPDHTKCLKLLHLVLDDEATPEEKEYFEKHVCNCMPYYEIYNVDLAIKSLVKKSCCGENVPSGLAAEIKAKLFQRAE
jgi:anti-sigma factor (TIGR02949 family)